MTAHNLFTLSDSVATRLSPSGTHSGVDFTVQNVNASGYIYLGSSDVSANNYGYRILPNHAISFELPPKDEIYAISSAPGMKAATISTALEGNE